MQRYRKRFLSLFFIFAFILSGIAFTGTNAQAADAIPVTLVNGGNVPYGGWNTHYYQDSANPQGTSYAYCLQPGQSGPAFTSYTGTPWNTPGARSLMYFGYGGPGFGDPNYGLGGHHGVDTKRLSYAYTHCALAYLYGSSDYCKGMSNLQEEMAFYGKWYSGAEDGICKDQFVPPNFMAYTVNTGSSTQVMATWRYDPVGNLDIYKVSANSAKTDGNSKYSLAGATFTLTGNGYSYTVSTGADGHARLENIPAGSYTLTEVGASTGYMAAASQTVTITSGATATVTVSEPPQLGRFELTKVSAKPLINACNENYSLAGAEFLLTHKETGAAYTLVTDANGKASVDNLPLGDYTLRETKSPKGFSLNYDTFLITINGGTTTYQTVENKPIKDPVQVVAYKNDASGPVIPQGDASLEGSVFHFDFYSKANMTEDELNSGIYQPIISFDAQTKDSYSAKYGMRPMIQLTSDSGCIIEASFRSTTGGLLNDYFNSGIFEFPLGSLVMYEKSAPEGYLVEGVGMGDFNNGSVTNVVYKNLKIIPINETGDRTSTVPVVNMPSESTLAKEQVVRGGVQIQKWDSEFNKSESQGDADLSGIKYEITNKSQNYVVVNGRTYQPGEVCATITTHWNDTLKAYTAETANDALPYGTYSIKEVATNNSYLLTDGTEYTFTIRENNKIVTTDTSNKNIVFKNRVVRGDVQIQKWDIESNKSEQHGDADLEGIKFDITNKSQRAVVVGGKTYQPNEVCATITTHWNDTLKAYTAETTGGALPYGTYSIKEVATNDSYLLTDNTEYTFTIRDNNVTVTTDTSGNTMVYKNRIVRGDVQIQKWDVELDKSEAIGGKNHGDNPSIPDLNGITFEITNKSRAYVIVDGQKYQRGEVCATITTHWNEDLQAYTAETTGGTLPYGTYGIKEVATNESYLLTDTAERTFVIRDEGVTVVDDTLAQPMVFKNQIVRGDIKFNKIADSTSERMSTLWKLTNLWTGECHLIAADPNGEFYTNSEDGFAHSIDTNANDVLFDRINNGEEIPISDVKFGTGVWFGLGEHGSMAPVNDALGALPYGKYELSEVHTDTNTGYDMQHFTFWVYRAEKTVDLGTITDDPTAHVEISTEAKDDMTGLHIGSVKENSNFSDTVSYSGLSIGQTYTLKCTLMDRLTGEAILDSEGNPITGEKTFKTNNESGSTVVNVLFDSRPFAGQNLVAFEALYDSDGFLLAEHADITDDNQMIGYPAMDTVAISNDTNMHDAPSVGETVITDTVTLNNLNIGTGYIVKGELRDAETGEVLRDPDGEKVTAIQDFTAEHTDHTIQMKFKFDASKFAGKKVVAYETLYHRDWAIVSHKDLEDEDQTIYFPQISTNAVDATSGLKELAIGENTSIEDTVTYSKLVPGETYRLVGKLMDKTTGELLDNVVGVTDFVPAESDGSVKVTFVFNSSDLIGHELVVYETLYHKDVAVVEHADINDKAQTVVFPQITTELLEQESGLDLVHATNEVVLVDRVDYTGLTVGKEYKILGSLVDREVGDAILSDGKPVTAEVTFTPKKSSGSVDVVFKLNATDVAGRDVVAYERLVRGDKELVIDENLENEDETVHFPKLTTIALGQSTGSHMLSLEEKCVLKDTLNYENLQEGQTYLISGVLMDAETGEELDIDGSTVDGKFKAKKGNGSVDVTFTIDTTKLVGKTIVVYERITTEDGVVVASHESLTSVDQTVYVANIATSAMNHDKTSKQVVKDANAIIVDTVSYQHLVPGVNYTLEGTIMDKATGKSVKGSDGKDVTATAVFTPSEANGETDVTLCVDATNLEGHTLVCFESLYDASGNLLAEHKDLNDESQSVSIVKKVVRANVQTGVDSSARKFMWIVLGMFVAITIVTTGIFIHMKRKLKR